MLRGNVEAEHRDAMHDGPDVPRNDHRIVTPDVSALLQRDDRIEEHLERSSALALQIGVSHLVAEHAAKHHAKVRRVSDGKPDVGHPHRVETTRATAGAFPRAPEIEAELAEPVGPDRLQQG